MTAPHTKGRVRIKNGRTLIADEDYYPLFQRLKQTNGEAIARANLERARLCWNTLAALDNATVERLGRWLDRYNQDEVNDMLREEGV